MRKLFFLLVFFPFYSCNNDSKQVTPPEVKDTAAIKPKKDSAAAYYHQFNDSSLENRITAAIMKLSFIKKADAYIDSFSNHAHGMAFMLDSLDKAESEIYVQAGYNGDTRFETYYHFYVNPKTLEIKVLDVINDKKLTVKEFLKSQK